MNAMLTWKTSVFANGRFQSNAPVNDMTPPIVSAIANPNNPILLAFASLSCLFFSKSCPATHAIKTAPYRSMYVLLNAPPTVGATNATAM